MRDKVIRWVWNTISIVLCLGAAGLLAWLCFISHAQGESLRIETATGIPIEWLFAAIGTLGLIVYGDMKRELRALRHEADKRAKMMARMSVVWVLVCRKLDIPWHPDNDRDD